MITFKQNGDFTKTLKFLKKMKSSDYLLILNAYGRRGVDALSSATPMDTGKTASSWNYDITTDSSGAHIYWTNSNVNQGVSIALILQYGHGTGTGAFVSGIDYINPAIRPIFDDIANQAWKEVQSS